LRRIVATFVGVSFLLLPSIAHAEVEDKIPGPITLVAANLACVGFVACVVGAMQERRVVRLAFLGVPAVLATMLLVELHFSDIANVVSIEMGKLYVAAAWTLFLSPAVGALAVVSGRV
jgi:hypothetical protein